MADEKKTTAAPKLLTAVRTGPSAIATTWENVASTGATYTSISFWVRVKGSGSYRQATQITTSAQINAKAYTITSIGGTALSPLAEYDVYLIASGPAGSSVPSNVISADLWFQAPTAPSVSSVTRVAVSSIQCVWENNVTARKPYTAIAFQVRPKTATGKWGQATQITTSAQINAGSYAITSIGGTPLNGTIEYEVRLVAYNTAGSATTGATTAAAWYQTPPGVTGLTGARFSPTDPRIAVTWSVPSTTARNRPTSQVLQWALAGRDSWTTVNLSAAARAWNLTDAKAQLGYKVRISTRNESGASTQVAEVSIGPQITAPAALSAPTAAVQPDGRIKIDWTATPTTDKPITSTDIWEKTQRGAAKVIASPSGGLRTYLRTLPANTVATYAVLPKNAVGSSPALSPYSGEVVTRPKGVLSAGVARSGTTGIVTLKLRNKTTDEATVATTWEIQHSTTAGAKTNPAAAEWFPVGSPAVVTALTQTWSHASIAGGVPHTYRIRPNRAGYTPTDADWVYSNELSAYAAPLAPTVYAPDSMDPTEPLVIRFDHNPVDYTAQTTAAWRHRKIGTTTWATGSGTTATSLTIPANTYAAGGQVEVQVQTRGASTTYGPYSASLIVIMRARPVVALMSPTSSPTGPSVDLTWSTAAQQAWKASVARGATVVSSLAGRDQTAKVPVDGLEDATAYTFSVEVFDGYQWSLPASITHTTSFIIPPLPVVTVRTQVDKAETVVTVRPRLQFRVTRVNFSRPIDQWASNTHDLPVVLIRPGGSEQVAASVVRGPVEDLADPKFNDKPRIYTGVTLPAGPATMSLTLSADRPAVARGYASLNGDLMLLRDVDVPVWPEVTQVAFDMAYGAGEVIFSLVNESPDGGTLYAFDPLWTGPPGEGAAEGAFDATTRREGYLYGWRGPTFGGYWEAVEGVAETTHTPVEVGDIAPAVSTVATRVQYSRINPAAGADWIDLGLTGSGWELVHRLPPLGVPIWYRGGSVGEYGGTAWGAPVEVVIDSDEVWINYGDDRTDAVHGGWNPKLSATAPGPIVTRKRYAGHDLDVLSWGSRRARSVTASVNVLPGDHGSTRQEWLRAAEHAGTVIYRDPDGEWLEGQLSDVTWGGESSLVHQVGLTVTEAR